MGVDPRRRVDGRRQGLLTASSSMCAQSKLEASADAENADAPRGSLFEAVRQLSKNCTTTAMIAPPRSTTRQAGRHPSTRTCYRRRREAEPARNIQRSNGSTASPPILEIEVDKLQVDRQDPVCVRSRMEKPRGVLPTRKMKAIQKERGAQERGKRSDELKKKIRSKRRRLRVVERRTSRSSSAWKRCRRCPRGPRLAHT